MYKETKKAVWTRSYINDLPDSAFLYIENGGKKDETNKTVPRSLRHWPIKDKSGKLDYDHVKNAISRIPQTKISGMSKERLNQFQEKARKLLEKFNKNVQKNDIVKLKESIKELSLRIDKQTELINEIIH